MEKRSRNALIIIIIILQLSVRAKVLSRLRSAVYSAIDLSSL